VLQPNEVVLEYVIAEPESYCLVIKHSHIEVVRLRDRKSIDDLAERHFNAIRAKSLAVTEGRQLYSAIAEPMQGMIQNAELIIIPDGGLHRIPFAALVDGEGRYLIETHTLNYAPSGTV
jgi:CHAT domain-containing protein